MALSMIKKPGAVGIRKEDSENYSLHTFIRQAIGKEPSLSFSEANDSPVQWIKLLNALDQQDLPGWPLLSPLKAQMQKCDKCSQEFCSTMNYRRHMRLHRRNLNLDKDSDTKTRGLLQVFWDKLSVEETMDIMSLNDVCVEGVTGPSVINELTMFNRKPGFTSLPQSYLKAGSVLLDIVLARPSRFPVSSQELFSILDDASENTFLCAGPAESLPKYVFDGEATKIGGLELRNTVACASFLVELKLVKSLIADQDAESLRCQKLLVEEEEAAQKRQAALLEKKKQKKIRQKEQRAKEQESSETDHCLEDRSPSPPISTSVITPGLNLEMSEILDNPAATPEAVEIVNLMGNVDNDHADGYPDLSTHQNVEHSMSIRSGRRCMFDARSEVPTLLKSANVIHASMALKPGPTQKHGSYKDSRSAGASGGKVWTPKPKSGSEQQAQLENVPSQDKKHEVIIGSMSVDLGNCIRQKHDENLDGAPGIAKCSTGKLQSCVNLSETDQYPVRNCNDASEVGSVSRYGSGDILRDDNISGTCEGKSFLTMEGGKQGGLRLSGQVAEDFLRKRWKQAMESDHVKVVLFPILESPPECPEVQDDKRNAAPSPESEHDNILSSAEYGPMACLSLESSTARKSNTRRSQDKGSKLKYVPKQRNLT